MSNDMKLIMEAWNSYVNEQWAAMAAQAQAKALEDLDIEEIFSDLRDWYESLDQITSIFVDIIDPTGLTDWPMFVDSWRAYLDWYMLDDDDPKKDPLLGADLFLSTVISLILIFPPAQIIPLGAEGGKALRKIGTDDSLISGFLKFTGGVLAIFDPITPDGYGALENAHLLVQQHPFAGDAGPTGRGAMGNIKMPKLPKGAGSSDRHHEMFKIMQKKVNKVQEYHNELLKQADKQTNRDQFRAAARFQRAAKEKEKAEKKKKEADKKKAARDKEHNKNDGLERYDDLMIGKLRTML